MRRDYPISTIWTVTWRLVWALLPCLTLVGKQSEHPLRKLGERPLLRLPGSASTGNGMTLGVGSSPGGKQKDFWKIWHPSQRISRAHMSRRKMVRPWARGCSVPLLKWFQYLCHYFEWFLNVSSSCYGEEGTGYLEAQVPRVIFYNSIKNWFQPIYKMPTSTPSVMAKAALYDIFLLQNATLLLKISPFPKTFWKIMCEVLQQHIQFRYL